MKLFGINVIAVPRETYFADAEEFYATVGNITTIYTLFDYDYAGVALMNKYKRVYNTVPLFFPKDMLKDFSDNLEDMGVESMRDYTLTIKQKLNL